MNFKKFISGISALTIAASAFAGLAISASAATTTPSSVEGGNSKFYEDFEEDARSDVAFKGVGGQDSYIWKIPNTDYITTTRNNKIFGVEGSGSAKRGELLSLDSARSTDTLIEFDMQMDPGNGSGGGTNESLVIGQSVASTSTGGANLGDEILNITGTNSSNGTFGTLTLNGEDVLTALTSGAAPNPERFNRTDYKHTTGWIHVKAQLSFSSQTIALYITRVKTGDVLYNKTVDFKSKAAEETTGATAVQYFAITSPKSLGGVYLDNVLIEDVPVPTTFDITGADSIRKGQYTDYTATVYDQYGDPYDGTVTLTASSHTGIAFNGKTLKALYDLESDTNVTLTATCDGVSDTKTVSVSAERYSPLPKIDDDYTTMSAEALAAEVAKYDFIYDKNGSAGTGASLQAVEGSGIQLYTNLRKGFTAYADRSLDYIYGGTDIKIAGTWYTGDTPPTIGAGSRIYLAFLDSAGTEVFRLYANRNDYVYGYRLNEGTEVSLGSLTTGSDKATIAFEVVFDTVNKTLKSVKMNNDEKVTGDPVSVTAKDLATVRMGRYYGETDPKNPQTTDATLKSLNIQEAPVASTVAISGADTIAAGETETYTATVTDQYGDTFDGAATFTDPGIAGITYAATAEGCTLTAAADLAADTPVSLVATCGSASDTKAITATAAPVTFNVTLTTTPYAKATVNGTDYYSGATGVIDLGTGSEGDTYTYTVVKGGYGTVSNSATVASEDLNISAPLTRNSGYLYYEDFDTVGTPNVTASLGNESTATDLFSIYAKYGTVNLTANNQTLAVDNASSGFRSIAYPLGVSTADFEFSADVVFPAAESHLLLRDSANQAYARIYVASNGAVTCDAVGTSYNTFNSSIDSLSNSLGTITIGSPVKVDVKVDNTNGIVIVKVGDNSKKLSFEKKDNRGSYKNLTSLMIGTARSNTITIDNIVVTPFSTAKFAKNAWIEASDGFTIGTGDDTNVLTNSYGRTMYAYKATLNGNGVNYTKIKGALKASDESTGTPEWTDMNISGNFTLYLITNKALNLTDSVVYCE